MSTKGLSGIALAWFAAGLGLAVCLTLPVAWLDSVFARRRSEWGFTVFNFWTGPLLWLIGFGVATFLWRVQLRHLAFGVGAGTLVIGLVLFVGSM
jgi:hypothetical protein